MTPLVARRLLESGHRIVVESGLGDAAGFPDSAYLDDGVEVSADLFEGADLILVVGPPTPELAVRIPEGAALVGFLDPFAAGDRLPAPNCEEDGLLARVPVR